MVSGRSAERAHVAPVQGERHEDGRTPRDIPAGWVTWEEHEEAWRGYHATYPNHQDAARIAQRGGFGYRELCQFLGRPPTTWRPRSERHAGFIPEAPGGPGK